MKAQGARGRTRAIAIAISLIAGLIAAPLCSGSNFTPVASENLASVEPSISELESYYACPYATPAGYQQAAASADKEHESDLTPVRCISDPYPTFNSIAVDSEKNIVVMSDTNRKSLLVYDRTANSKSGEEVEPRRQIMGPNTQVGFVAGVAMDAENQEIFTVNNDIEDTLMVFSYDDEGNVVPKRLLAVPHQAWGLSLSKAKNEFAVSVQSLDALVFYRREAKGLEPPTRSLLGKNTGLADPHGVYIDDLNKEIVVANHGNWGESDVSAAHEGNALGGQFRLPSITVYPDTASGDTKPLRTISGKKSLLNWPMGVTVDTTRNEIYVANNGDSSVLVFGRDQSGDIAPVRIIKGAKTGIDRPMAVAVDTKNNEILIANFGDHSAVVFDRGARGNVAPKRIIRNAPAGTPTGGFGNPMAVAYDTKRQEILVPN
jgi:6-phosphogluconolactonase (cycloisomerase 2 family)